MVEANSPPDFESEQHPSEDEEYQSKFHRWIIGVIMRQIRVPVTMDRGLVLFDPALPGSGARVALGNLLLNVS